jgi:GNAT superfamily N-acetyltransferase
MRIQEVIQRLVEGVEVIQGIEPEDYPLAEALAWEYFRDFADSVGGDVWAYTLQQSDPSISFKVLAPDGKVAGFYFLGPGQVPVEGFEDLRGVEGVALMVQGDSRGSGLGSALKDAPRRLGIDYVWGYQAKGLHNLEHWRRRREIVAEDEDTYVTMEIFGSSPSRYLGGREANRNPTS